MGHRQQLDRLLATVLVAARPTRAAKPVTNPTRETALVSMSRSSRTDVELLQAGRAGVMSVEVV
jgi:hypothetical protein